MAPVNVPPSHDATVTLWGLTDGEGTMPGGVAGVDPDRCYVLEVMVDSG